MLLQKQEDHMACNLLLVHLLLGGCTVLAAHLILGALLPSVRCMDAKIATLQSCNYLK